MDTNKEQLYTIDEIIEASFDFSDYSEEEKEKTLQEVSGMIIEASLLKLASEASEELQLEFQSFIETEPTEEQMGNFVQKNFPNFQEIVLSELDLFLNSQEESGDKNKDKELA